MTVLARWISDCVSPVWVVAVISTVIGALSGDLVGGMTIGALTGLLPGLAISWLNHRGKIASGWHVTSRSDRTPVFAFIGLCLVLAVAFSLVVGISRPLTALLAAEIWLVVFAGALTVGLKKKPSMHVAVWLGGWLGVSLLSPWALIPVMATPVVAWSRTKISHHTLKQVVAGAIAGLTAFPVFFFVLG